MSSTINNNRGGGHYKRSTSQHNSPSVNTSVVKLIMFVFCWNWQASFCLVVEQISRLSVFQSVVFRVYLWVKIMKPITEKNEVANVNIGHIILWCLYEMDLHFSSQKSWHLLDKEKELWWKRKSKAYPHQLPLKRPSTRYTSCLITVGPTSLKEYCMKWCCCIKDCLYQRFPKKTQKTRITTLQ